MARERVVPIVLLMTISLASFSTVLAQQEGVVKKDLQPEWMVFDQGHYQSFSNHDANVNTIYFWLEPVKFSGGDLKISSPEPFAIFVDGELAVQSASPVVIDIDSLMNLYSNTTRLMAIHQKVVKQGGLLTVVETPTVSVRPSSLPLDKPKTFFHNFVVTALLILLVMLIVLIQLNPRLASDYFSVTRIFSQRESDDAQVYTRITSSTNILFYLYCSLMLGFCLMIIFKGVSFQYSVALGFQSDTFFSALIAWFKLSLIVLVAFFLKIMIVYSTSSLFGVKEISGIHFFNWVRVLLMTFGLLTVMLFIYFIMHGQNQFFYGVLLGMVKWILIGWMLIIFFKLNGRKSYSVFHLFSYICATEVIPLLITIKVLYN